MHLKRHIECTIYLPNSTRLRGLHYSWFPPLLWLFDWYVGKFIWNRRNKKKEKEIQTKKKRKIVARVFFFFALFFSVHRSLSFCCWTDVSSEYKYWLKFPISSKIISPTINKKEKLILTRRHFNTVHDYHYRKVYKYFTTYIIHRVSLVYIQFIGI